MKNLNTIDIKNYLTFDDVSYITGFHKNTLRTFCNKNHHSYRPDFPKPIRVNLGKARDVFDRVQILSYIQKYPKFFKRSRFFEFEFSTPTFERDYFSAQIYHKPTETSILFKIAQEEFELLNKYGFDSVDTRVLTGRLLRRAIRKSSIL